MAEQLQATLNPETQIRFLLAGINRLLRIDGLCYTCEEELNIQTGRQASHSCGYRLIKDEVLLGELVFRRDRKFTEHELELLESVLSVVISPLRNALEYRRAVIAALQDCDTGAGSRQAMDDILRRDIELAKRHNQSLSIVILELSQMRDIQKQCGRDHVDGIRSALVRETKLVCRETDGVFRMDADSFVVILNQTGAEQSAVFLDRLMRSLQQIIAEEKIPALQIGRATLTGTDSPASLLDRACRATVTLT